MEAVSSHDCKAANGSEFILTLREHERAPEGYEIVRILREGAELTGPGANYRSVYVVVAREAERG